MTLAFPNPARSFDATRNVVQFTGYDGMAEVSFGIEAAALADPALASGETSIFERAVLLGFDAKLSMIHKAAHRVYVPGRRTAYRLAAPDIR
jgi:hypothetical protein